MFVVYVCAANSYNLDFPLQSYPRHGDPSCSAMNSQHSHVDEHSKLYQQRTLQSDTELKLSSASNSTIPEQLPVQESLPKQTLSIHSDAPAAAAGRAHNDVD